MELHARVLTLAELGELIRFESDLNSHASASSGRTPDDSADDILHVVASWHSRARQEALEYYLPLGWSFGAWDNKERLQGFFLAQPLLFFRGQTQSLWVEHVSASGPGGQASVRQYLIELAVQWARDKHFQRALFSPLAAVDGMVSLGRYRTRPLDGEIFEVEIR